MLALNGSGARYLVTFIRERSARGAAVADN